MMTPNSNNLFQISIVEEYRIFRTINFVPARISKGQGAGPEKGLFSALLDFQKRHFLGTLVKSKKNKMKY
jgi:hypothetical protein